MIKCLRSFGLWSFQSIPLSFILVLKVGWILSELDDLQLSPPPPVSVLPIGTGNDLSRELNWGAVSHCVIVGYR